MSTTVRSPWRSPRLREQQWTLFHWALNLCQKNASSIISVPTNVLELRTLKEILFYLHLMLFIGGAAGGWGSQEVERTK